MIINSTITPNMTFTKTSQKFGQWADSRANTVFGLGFASEQQLAKVSLLSPLIHTHPSLSSLPSSILTPLLSSPSPHPYSPLSSLHSPLIHTQPSPLSPHPSSLSVLLTTPEDQ